MTDFQALWEDILAAAKDQIVTPSTHALRVGLEEFVSNAMEDRPLGPSRMIVSAWLPLAFGRTPKPPTKRRTWTKWKNRYLKERKKIMTTKCPNCCAVLAFQGYTGSGHSIFRCPKCHGRFQIKVEREPKNVQGKA